MGERERAKTKSQNQVHDLRGTTVNPVWMAPINYTIGSFVINMFYHSCIVTTTRTSHTTHTNTRSHTCSWSGCRYISRINPLFERTAATALISLAMSATEFCALFLSTCIHLLDHCAIERANVAMYIQKVAVLRCHGYQRFYQIYNLISECWWFFLQFSRPVLRQIHFVLDKQNVNDKVITAKSKSAASQEWRNSKVETEKKHCLICIQSDYNDEANTYTHTKYVIVGTGMKKKRKWKGKTNQKKSWLCGTRRLHFSDVCAFVLSYYKIRLHRERWI